MHVRWSVNGDGAVSTSCVGDVNVSRQIGARVMPDDYSDGRQTSVLPPNILPRVHEEDTYLHSTTRAERGFDFDDIPNTKLSNTPPSMSMSKFASMVEYH